MKEKIYEVRKHGSIKVESEAEAIKVMVAAKKEGYKFGRTYHHFTGHQVVDMDN